MTKDFETHSLRPNLPFKLLTKKELAKFLGCTERTVDRMVAARTVPFVLIPHGPNGRYKRRFDSRDIDLWLDQRRCNAEDNPPATPSGNPRKNSGQESAK